MANWCVVIRSFFQLLCLGVFVLFAWFVSGGVCGHCAYALRKAIWHGRAGHWGVREAYGGYV